MGPFNRLSKRKSPKDLRNSPVQSGESREKKKKNTQEDKTGEIGMDESKTGNSSTGP